MPISVKWRDKEVTKQPQRTLVAALVIACVPLIILATVVAVVLCLASVPLHFILRACGRRGFVEPTRDGSLHYHVRAAGFRKA